MKLCVGRPLYCVHVYKVSEVLIVSTTNRGSVRKQALVLSSSNGSFEQPRNSYLFIKSCETGFYL